MSLIPSTQLELFIHGNELNNFVSLYKRNKLPNRILLKGRKGIGKCTLAYHLINFILSEKEDFSYNTDSLKIDERSKSFKPKPWWAYGLFYCYLIFYGYIFWMEPLAIPVQ